MWVIQIGQGVQGENTADFIKSFYFTIDWLCFLQFFMQTELYLAWLLLGTWTGVSLHLSQKMLIFALDKQDTEKWNRFHPTGGSFIKLVPQAKQRDVEQCDHKVLLKLSSAVRLQNLHTSVGSWHWAFPAEPWGKDSVALSAQGSSSLRMRNEKASGIHSEWVKFKPTRNLNLAFQTSYALQLLCRSWT